MDKSQELFDKIKSQKIQQKPKWYFQFKNYFFWLLFTGFILLGSLSFSVILFAIQQTDFDLLNHLSHSPLEFILGIAPLVWLVTLIVFLMIAMMGIRNSKKGYKFSLSNMIAFSISFSIVLGTLFFISGGAQYLETSFATSFSNYKSIESLKISRWSNPESGYLSGTIINISDDELEIEDFDQKRWKIDITDARLRGNKSLETNAKMKFIGEKTGHNQFKASEIRNWGGNGRGPSR